MLSAILLTVGLFAQAKPFDPAKERVILIAVGNVYHVFAGTGDVLEWRMSIKADGVTPGPGPIPPKPPEPSLTDVGKVSKSEAEKLTGAARAKAKDVGGALRKAGQEVMDNALSTPADVLAKIKAKTNAVLLDLAPAWKDWGVAVALKMKDANPTTPAGWADLLQQAAEGVEAVK